MTTSAPADMCRLVVHGPQRRIEIAVPAEALVIDLLPGLLTNLGEDLADAGMAHGGWVLQRLGEAPFDEESSVATLGLSDGAVVHLRPRAEQIPPVHFDDLADGLATSMRERPGVWQPAHTRWAALAGAAAALCTAVAAFVAPGPAGIRSAAAAVLTLLLLCGAVAYARSFGDRAFALLAGVGAIVVAGLCAAVIPEAAVGSAGLPTGAPELFAAAVVVGAIAPLVGGLIGWGGPLVAAVVAFAIPLAAGAGLEMLAGSQPGRGAATTAVLATLLGIAAPRIAVLLAGIRLNPLPARAEHLQEDIDPEPADVMLARAASADKYVTGIYAGLGCVTVAGLVVLSGTAGWAAYTTVVLVAVARLLAARPMIAGYQRLAVAAPSVAGLIAVSTVELWRADPTIRVLVTVAGVIACCVSLYALAGYLPGRRMMPIWGRAGDLVQTAAMIALIPVLGQFFGLYALARSIGG